MLMVRVIWYEDLARTLSPGLSWLIGIAAPEASRTLVDAVKLIPPHDSPAVRAALPAPSPASPDAAADYVVIPGASARAPEHRALPTPADSTTTNAPPFSLSPTKPDCASSPPEPTDHAIRAP